MDPNADLIFNAVPFAAAGVVALGVWGLVRAVRSRAKNRGWALWLRIASSVALLVAGLALTGLAVLTAPMRASFGAEGELAPGLRYTTAGGEVSSLGELGGAVRVVNLWATWCAPCIEEMPELARLQATYGDRVSVVALSNEEPETVEAFLARRPLEVEVGLVGDSLPAPYASGFGALPTTFVLDREGVVRKTLIGGSTFEVFDDAVRPLLGAELEDG